jgi:hypothetical protein
VNFLCRASRGGARQRKATDGARTKRHVTAFAMRWQKKTHDNLLPLPCAAIESARQSLPFAVRRHKNAWQTFSKK